MQLPRLVSSQKPHSRQGGEKSTLVWSWQGLLMVPAPLHVTSGKALHANRHQQAAGSHGRQTPMTPLPSPAGANGFDVYTGEEELSLTSEEPELKTEA